LARAVARLGTARGIAAFQRYGYIERNGQSNLAVPIGRFHVPSRISPRISCLDDLEAWLPRLHREARDDHAPARLKQAERRLADALFAVAQHPDENSRWQTVLLALGEVEAIHVHGGKLRTGPIPALRSEWVAAAGLHQPEMRLALAFAMQAVGFNRERLPINSVRRHWLPGKNEETAAVLQGRSGITDAIALVERRLIEAAQRGSRRLPLLAAPGTAAHPADLAAWLAGEVDPDRTLALARALMALDCRAWAAHLPSPAGRGAGGEGTAHAYPDDAWLVLRLALLPWPLKDGREIKADPAIYRRLSSGDAAGAVELALRRLSAAGIHAAVRAAALSPATARLWAAALAFPINRNTAENFLRTLNPNQATAS
jgi:CRISPR-associated protein Csx17